MILRRYLRIVGVLVLLAQIGLLAHRLEHYFAPNHMESGEDACVAFAPASDPPAIVPLVRPPSPIAFPVRYWIGRDTRPELAPNSLGFRAQAPPV